MDYNIIEEKILARQEIIKDESYIMMIRNAFENENVN